MLTALHYFLGVLAVTSAGLAGWANGEGKPQKHFVSICGTCMLMCAIISFSN